MVDGHPINRLDELLPWAWKVRRFCQEPSEVQTGRLLVSRLSSHFFSFILVAYDRQVGCAHYNESSENSPPICKETTLPNRLVRRSMIESGRSILQVRQSYSDDWDAYLVQHSLHRTEASLARFLFATHNFGPPARLNSPRRIYQNVHNFHSFTQGRDATDALHPVPASHIPAGAAIEGIKCEEVALQQL
jgi:hypothetical protein